MNAQARLFAARRESRSGEVMQLEERIGQMLRQTGGAEGHVLRSSTGAGVANERVETGPGPPGPAGIGRFRPKPLAIAGRGRHLSGGDARPARRSVQQNGRPAPAMSSPLAGIARFPRVRLGHMPTPLEPAPNLGAALGIELWIKRDDCTGLALGGNKVRQLEFHFGEARARGADTVLVTGAVQSNLVCIAAAAARRLGMAIHIQLEDRVKGAGDLYCASGNLLLDRVLGATLHAFPEGEDEAAADAAMERRAAALAAEGRKPYVIHSAPDCPPLGGLGYVLAAGEVAEQAGDLRIGFDAAVTASGSALTHAGLLVGLRALGERVPVLGICVRRDGGRQGARVAQVGSGLAAMIGWPDAFDAGEVEVCDAVLAPGYGRLNDAVREAMALAARHEGLLLDPVYTARAMAGLIGHVRSGRIAPASRVLFVHTGGQPALFAYGESLGPWLSEAPGGRTG